MHDVFPRNIQDYLPWLKTARAKGGEHMVVLEWDQPFIDSLDADIADLEKKAQDVVDAKKVYTGAVNAKDDALDESQKKMRPVVSLVQLNEDVSDELRGEMGIKVHDKIPSHEVPNIPSDLQVKPLPEGANESDWSANGNKSGTQYIVEARYGTEGDFVHVDTVTATKFLHENQTVGAAVYYRITARRGKLTSLPCLPVGVYT